jgi:3-deoxy-D-manno-octulosonate 8-phosphate phosphatase (KDO 8-P phosphatase)
MDIDAIFLDFDGVLTDNSVTLDQNGNEWVTCSRADGLAFDALRALKVKAVIVSSEKNLVVTARAKKLQVPVLQNVTKKDIAIKKFCSKHQMSLKRCWFIGNDVNDILAMKMCGMSFCPADAHHSVKKIASHLMETKGGQGVVRELLELYMKVNIEDVLYSERRIK